MCPVLLFLNARTNSSLIRWRVILWHKCRTVWNSSGPPHSIIIIDIRQPFIEMSPWQILDLWVFYSKYLMLPSWKLQSILKQQGIEHFLSVTVIVPRVLPLQIWQADS
jgi:hypothetical protein